MAAVQLLRAGVNLTIHRQLARRRLQSAAEARRVEAMRRSASKREFDHNKAQERALGEFS